MRSTLPFWVKKGSFSRRTSPAVARIRWFFPIGLRSMSGCSPNSYLGQLVPRRSGPCLVFLCHLCRCSFFLLDSFFLAKKYFIHTCASTRKSTNSQPNSDHLPEHSAAHNKIFDRHQAGMG